MFGGISWGWVILGSFFGWWCLQQFQNGSLSAAYQQYVRAQQRQQQQFGAMHGQQAAAAAPLLGGVPPLTRAEKKAAKKKARSQQDKEPSSGGGDADADADAAAVGEKPAEQDENVRMCLVGALLYACMSTWFADVGVDRLCHSVWSMPRSPY
jgi:hypothetical protein